ncbi:hypothetical protein HAX54_045366 [Datura stramonium]|uniref:Uncharacterized protein n=1 Tax=Datura stramonium TaxID=4076 RepID=A0ABS8SQU3_DATST|nr:hypothetical protein [Datura stramonium]
MGLHLRKDSSSLPHKFASDVPSKLHSLRRPKDELRADAPLLSEFFPTLLDLVSDRFSPVRKLTAEVVGYIGFKHGEFLPDIVPVLISALKDDTSAVAHKQSLVELIYFVL